MSRVSLGQQSLGQGLGPRQGQVAPWVGLIGPSPALRSQACSVPASPLLPYVYLPITNQSPESLSSHTWEPQEGHWAGLQRSSQHLMGNEPWLGHL